jgi:translation initiation factor 2B subunit (eIF-2B alpha/beta/delta family)
MKLPSELMRLGLKITNEEIVGETNLVLTALKNLKTILSDYTCPDKETVKRDLERKIKSYQAMFKEFDQGSEGLETAFKTFFVALSSLPIDVNTSDAINWLMT